MPNQQRDENSLLSWMIRAIRIRKECPEFGRGELEILSATPADALFCHICETGEEAVLALHNFAGKELEAEFNIGKRPADHLIDLFRGTDLKPDKNGTCKLTLEGYGYRWFRLHRKNRTDTPAI